MRVVRLLCLLVMGVALLPLLGLAGCSAGSSGTSSGGGAGSTGSAPTGSVVLVHSSANPRLEVDVPAVPPQVDTLEFKGFDAFGNQVYGWTRRAYAPTVWLDDVPLSVRRLHIDYLRNSGFALRTAEVAVEMVGGVARIVDPPHQAAAATPSVWAVTGSGTAASPYQVTLNGDAFVLKGIDYSPVPIGGADYYPPYGDYFYNLPAGQEWQDWHEIYERDLPNLRAMNANCIRTYSFNAWAPYGAAVPCPPTPSPCPWNGVSEPAYWTDANAADHTTFLDKCWNNGNDPVYVMIGIPLNASAVASPLDTNWNTYFQKTITYLVDQYGSHPAVMGFCIGNEQNQPGRCYDQNGQANSPFWSQINLYAGLVKTNANNGANLLTTVAFQDDANLYASSPKGLAVCTQIDLWMQNVYSGPDFGEYWQDYENNMQGQTFQKPVAIGEWGDPGTTRSNPSDPSTIQYTATSQANSATRILCQLRDLYTATGTSGNTDHLNYCVGGFFFEYSDEWWNQVAANPSSYPQFNGNYPPYDWYGGVANGTFSNGYWDQDGFGLYSVAVGPASSTDPTGPTRPPQSPWDASASQPYPADVLTPTAALATITDFFGSLSPSPSPSASPSPCACPSPSPEPSPSP